MIAILSLFLVLVLSILVTRIATVILIHTGLSRQSARFQARSAFSGVGFTTSESERVVGHPVRRRVVLTLMLLGNAGIVTAVSTLILGFVGPGGSSLSLTAKVVLIVAGLAALWTIASSQWFDALLSRQVEAALARFTDLEVRDYASLMHLAGDYRLAELAVESGDWIADRPLSETRLRDEGVIVLGIRRADRTYLGAPDGATRILGGDTALLYGRDDSIRSLDVRRRDAAGDLEHLAASDVQEERAAVEERMDPARREAGEDGPADPD